jgi:hypothetical protein
METVHRKLLFSRRPNNSWQLQPVPAIEVRVLEEHCPIVMRINRRGLSEIKRRWGEKFREGERGNEWKDKRGSGFVKRVPLTCVVSN